MVNQLVQLMDAAAQFSFLALANYSAHSSLSVLSQSPL